MVGVLFPCGEKPLECGEGYKTCECVNDDCSETQMTECLAQCWWVNSEDPTCDKYKGKIKDEICNNWDDNCNELIDEDLIQACYNGPPETLGVGICKGSLQYCYKGTWGESWQGTFVEGLCPDEILPKNSDTCNGIDENCDGVVDENTELVDTDILFIIDTSGSMEDEINAVMAALVLFAEEFEFEDKIRWGVVLAPTTTAGASDDFMQLHTDLTEFDTFMNSLANKPIVGTDSASEMVYDAIYASLYSLVGMPPYHLFELTWDSWFVADSDPPLEQFKIDWRVNANRVVITFSDEEGQSHTNPEILQEHLTNIISSIPKLDVYTFSESYHKENSQWGGKKQGYNPLALASQNGKWFELVSNAPQMYANLLEIINTSACE
jgi:hypothetical protein